MWTKIKYKNRRNRTKAEKGIIALTTREEKTKRKEGSDNEA